MPEDQESQHWFVLLNGKRYGPYTLPALVKGVEKGVIGESAGVWRPGWEQWRTASDIPELFKPEPIDEPDTREAAESKAQTETAEAPATSPDEPAEAEEKHEPEPVESAEAVADDQVAADEPADAELATTAPVEVSAAPEPMVAVSEPAIAVPEPAIGDPEPANADPEPAKAEFKAEAKETESPREVRESSRRNRFRDGPDLFGRGFARSDPVRLEPIRSDKPDPAKPDPVRREKRDLAKIDFPAAPGREGVRDPGSRDPGPRDLLARAIPSELGAPDIGSRKSPLTDAALRGRLNTMLASADLDVPRKGAAKEPVTDDGPSDAEEAAEPAPEATKPQSAVERLSDVSSVARSRKLEIAPGPEPPKLSAGAPPVFAPAPEPEPEGTRRGLLPVILSVVATLVAVCAVAWVASALGLIRVEFLPMQNGTTALQSLPGALSRVRPHATVDGLPDIVANMPAVIALKMADPDAYGKFLKRFTAVYHDNEPDDVILTQARTALRKSVKHLLANATNESLLEVTEVNLAYMRGLAQGNAGSCVALSDESKGAVLDSNLARDFPPLFGREMAVLERVISNAGAKQAAPTEAEVRPYLEAVFTELKKKPVQIQLLGHDKLTAAEYGPYCDLVIAFYEGVRSLPFGDAVKLLRNLYAAAATDPDKT